MNKEDKIKKLISTLTDKDINTIQIQKIVFKENINYYIVYYTTPNQRIPKEWNRAMLRKEDVDVD